MVLPSKAFNQKTHLCLTTFMKRLNRCNTYIYSIFSWNILYKDQICFPPKLFTYSRLPSSKDKLFTGKVIEHPMIMLSPGKQFNLILLYLTNVQSSGISFCTNFKFFYSVLYPVGPLDWYFKLLCCKLRNMVKYILLCYCWCLTFRLCYFFTFFSNYDRQLLSLMQILILHAQFFWCQAYSYIPYEGQVEAVQIYSLYFPIPAACGTFMGILGLCGDL